jgi:hypothetical protein
MMRFVTAYSSGQGYPGAKDSHHLDGRAGAQPIGETWPDPPASVPAAAGTATWQELGYSVPDSPAVPGTPLPGGPDGPLRGTPKGWFIWGGTVAVLAVVVVITLVVAVRHGGGSVPAAQPGQHSGTGSTGSNPQTASSLPQQCQLVVDPLYQQFASIYSQSQPVSSNMPQAALAYRRAAQRVSGDPPLASDLDAVANDLQKEYSDLSASSTASQSTIENDMKQEGLDFEALYQLCPHPQ